MRLHRISPIVRFSSCLAAVLLAAPGLRGQIAITEIHYNPGPDGEDGRRREFVEIFNQSPEPFDLSGCFFSRGLGYTFPAGTWLAGHAYLVVAADANYIRTTYSITNVVGPWDATTALANGGESISIAEPSGTDMVRLRYNDRGKWPAAADGTGHTLALRYNYSEVNDPDSWAHSSAAGGSPGRANPAPGTRPVVINEALTWSSGQRWVEIYNPSASPVSLAGFRITDDPLDLDKATLAPGTTVPGRGWLAFTDVELGLDFTPVPNPPNPGVGRTFVALVDAAGTRVIDAYTFEPDLEDLSEARDPDGNEDWADAATPTQGASNLVEVETEIVISELMYHSQDDDPSDEFVELYNRGTLAVDLEGCAFVEGIDFVFPAVTLPPGEFLVVARNPDRIRAIYGLSAAQVVGPAQDLESLDAFGVLANSGERITLADRNRNVMDTLRWYDGGDWPRWADGLGSTLELIDPFSDNSVGSAWDSSDDSAKAPVETFSYTSRHSGGENELHFVLMNRGIAIIDDVEIRSGGTSLVVDETYIPFGGNWRYLKGTQEASSPVTAWRGRTFTDTSWTPGGFPIGYGEPAEGIVTTLSDMQQAGANPGYLSLYCRRTFTVASTAAVDRLFLEVRYDDGFIAYINGTQVAARNTTGAAFDAPAGTAGEPTTELIDISTFKSALVNGSNALSLQLHNANLPSSDALLNARLVRGHLQPGGGGPNLVNNGTFDANDSGWIIEGNHIWSGRTAEDPIAGAGSLKLIATGRGDNKVNRIETETQPLNTTDTYTVSFKARWVVGSRTVLTHGFQNLDTGLARSHQLTIPEDLGTPGAVNSVTARQVAERGDANLGPTISRVNQDPAVPQANEGVTVRARIEDPDGVASARAIYFLNRPGAGTPIVPEPVGIFYDHRDVGGPCTEGGTTSSSATSYNVTGSGADIWAGGDQFQYAYTYATGDFTMTARLATKTWAPGSTWGKVGIMARQSLSSTARYAFVHDSGEDPANPDYFARLAWRPTDGGSDNAELGIAAAGQHPAWLRLQRVGNLFRGFGSANGTTWTQMGEVNWGVGAPATVLLGLAVTSHADCATTTIGFQNVTITGTTGGPPATGSVCTTTACEVALTDPDGDGTWTGVIPGRPLGTKVLYAIEAVDGNGEMERYPPDRTRRSHPFLLDPDDPDPAAQGYNMYRHDVRNIDPTGAFHKYRYVMHDLDEAYLDTRQTQSNDPVDGTFIFGATDIYHGSRIRFAGSPWARGKWGSFRLRFPNDKPLHGEKHQFNLDTVQGDLMSARERISNYIFRANSRPGAPVVYGNYRKVRFWVNSRDIGIRDHVEVPNGEIIERWFPGDDDGDLFEVDDRFEFNDGGGRINSRDGRLLYPPYGANAEDQEEYRWYFNLRRDEDGDNYANLIDVARVFDPADTSDVQFDQIIEGSINLENFLRTWAVRMNSDDWDTWGTNRGKNCYLYRTPSDGRWHLIPWDMELTWGAVNAFPHPTGSTGSFGFAFGEVNRLLNRPRLRRRYYGILKEMIDGPFRSAYLTPYMTRLDALGFNGGTTAIGKAGGFVDQRRTLIQGWINSVVSPQVDFAITSPNGGNAASVAAPTVNLGGTAPVEVFAIEVINDRIEYQAGEVAAAVFSASSMTAWTLSGIPLAPGLNVLTLIGVNSQGTAVDQDTIGVTYTGNWNAPAITGITPGSARPGQTITVVGTDFHTGLQVFFGATAASGVVFNEATDPTRITVTVPALAAASYQVKVRNTDAKESNLVSFTVEPPPAELIRGDANMDQKVDLADPLKVLLHLFGGQAAACRDAMDANDDGRVNDTDAVYVLTYLYRGGAAPPVPFPGRGVDSTTDVGGDLGCATGLP